AGVHRPARRDQSARQRRTGPASDRQRDGELMLERRLFFYIDWLLLAAGLLLTALGLAVVYSTTYDALQGKVGPQFSTQLSAVVIGLVALLVCLTIDYRRLSEYSLVLFALLAVVLVGVLFFGVVRGGARRWIAFGPITIQPSEFAKIGLAMVVA